MGGGEPDEEVVEEDSLEQERKISGISGVARAGQNEGMYGEKSRGRPDRAR